MQDYPSVGEIRDLLFNYSVIPVFATLENIKQYYEAINVLLERTGPQLVTIQDGSANIVEAIESSIEVKHWTIITCLVIHYSSIECSF